MVLFVLFILIAAFYNYPHLPVILPGLTIVKLVGIVVLIVAFGKALASNRNLGMFRHWEPRLYVLLLSLMFMSAAAAGFHTAQTMYLWTYLSHLAFYFIAVVTLTSKEKLSISSHWVVASILLMSLSVVNERVRWGVPRPGGIAGDPNYFALTAVCFLPLCILAVEHFRGVRRLFFAASGVVIIGAIYLGASRGGALALAATVGYSLMHLRRKVLYGSLSVATVVALLFVVPTSLVERITVSDYGSQLSVDARYDLWDAGLKMVVHNPIFGVGPAEFKPATEQYSEGHSGQIAHNTYIEVAAELGIPALIVWLLILFLNWSRLRRLGKRLTAAGDSLGAWMANSFKVGLVGYAIAGIFVSAGYIRHTWFLIFFGVILDVVTRKRPDGPVAPAAARRTASYPIRPLATAQMQSMDATGRRPKST